jgi:hypothetical protein
VRARDAAGNWGPTSTRKLQISSLGPTITALTSRSHPDPNKWYSNATATFSWSAGGASSGTAGYAWLLDHFSGSTPLSTITTGMAAAECASTADGVWYFHVRAQSISGVWGTPQQTIVRIDTHRPTPQTNAATVRRDAQLTLHYRLSDPLPSCGSGTVKIVIKNQRGRVVKSVTVANAVTNTNQTWRFRCTLARGTYSVVVTGTDAAGNHGAKSVTAQLKVK